MTDGEPDAGLGERDAGTHEQDGNQQRVTLVVCGGVRQPLLDRRPMGRGQDQSATAGSRHHHGGDLSDPLRAEEKEYEQPGGGRHRAPTRKGQVATQRHDRDGRRRRSLSPQGPSRGSD